MPSGAVREGDFKLIEFYEDGRLELFNLREDLGETRNLTATNPGKARELQQLLQRWRRSVDATMPESNPGYDPAKSDQGLTGAQPPCPLLVLLLDLAGSSPGDSQSDPRL